MSIVRDDTPPRPGPSMPVVRVKETTVSTFTVLGSKIHGYWTHWSGTRTTPCRSHGETCAGCQRQWPKRWKGYLHVLNHHAQAECFLELTPAAAEIFASALSGRTNYRGVRFNACRSKGGPQGRLRITFLPDWEKVEMLSAEKDSQPTMEKLWDAKS